MAKNSAIVAAATTAMLAGAAMAATPTPGLAALALAYNLECLEAEFYWWAAYGEALNEEQRGGGPMSSGAQEGYVPSEVLSEKVLEIATEIAQDELAHVLFLRGAVELLTGVSLACPKIDVSPEVFNLVATVAVRAGLNDQTVELDPIFNPYANDLFFLHGAFIFEDVGVTAYRGAVPLVLQFESPDVRELVTSAAAGILGVEAYHSGIVRDRLSLSDAMPYGFPVTTVVQIISDLRDSVSETDQDQGIVNEDGTLNLVPTDENGIAFARTATEAVSILTLGTDSSPFFPEGFAAAPIEGVDFNVPEACDGGAGRFEQCGGATFEGPTCCSGNNQCVMVNEFYSQCKPVTPVAGEVGWYGQCGGQNYDGPTTCEAKSTCVEKNAFYSQCVPDSKVVTSAASIGLISALAGIAGVAVIGMVAVVTKRRMAPTMMDNAAASSVELPDSLA